MSEMLRGARRDTGQVMHEVPLEHGVPDTLITKVCESHQRLTIRLMQGLSHCCRGTEFFYSTTCNL